MKRTSDMDVSLVAWAHESARVSQTGRRTFLAMPSCWPSSNWRVMLSSVRIGEFATAAGVPVKTLRYYDDLGLFRPARKHPTTGYRDYAPAQLADLAAILALRELGMPLTEIK